MYGKSVTYIRVREFYKTDREVLHIPHVRVNRKKKQRVKEQPRQIDTLIDVMRVIEFSNHSF